MKNKQNIFQGLVTILFFLITSHVYASFSMMMMAKLYQNTSPEKQAMCNQKYPGTIYRTKDDNCICANNNNYNTEKKDCSKAEGYILSDKENNLVDQVAIKVENLILQKGEGFRTSILDKLNQLKQKFTNNKKNYEVITAIILKLTKVPDNVSVIVNNKKNTPKNEIQITNCSSNQKLVGGKCIENKLVDKVNIQECLDTKSSLEQLAQKIKGDSEIAGVYWNSLNARKATLSKSGKSYIAIEGDPIVIALNIDIEKIKQNLVDSKKAYNEGNKTLFEMCNIKASDLFCDSNEHIESDKCIVSSKSCNFPNGIGMQFWNNGVWGACQNTAPSCPDGYEDKNGKCYPKADNTICTSTQHKEGTACFENSKSCGISNGTGTQTWNGNSWLQCLATSCNAGYEKNNGTCALKQITIPISSSTSASGSNYQGCSASDIIIGNQLWSACNVGASTPLEAGYYYMWGNNTNYSSNQTSLVWSWQNKEKGPCSDGYHIPTSNEWKTALNEFGWSWLKLKNSLGITLNGYYNNGVLTGKGISGFYWTSFPSFGADIDTHAYSMTFQSIYTPNEEYRSIDLGWQQPKKLGFSVRCIKN